MKAQIGVLRDYADFRRLFVGSSISLMGSSVTTVALPLTAVLVLGASPLQMGLLGAISFLPNLILGLPAGVLVERIPYRRTVVLADLGAAAALAAVPILAATSILEVWHLYVVAVVTGTCSLFSLIAAQSFTPSLVPRRDLLPANGALVTSNSVVAASGSALGGLLVQILSAPFAVATDVISFLISAALKSRISISGHSTASDRAREPMLRAIWIGLQVATGHPVLRAMTIAAAVGAFAGQMQVVILTLFLVRELNFSPGLVGLAMAVGGLAGILGATIGVQVTERLGNGLTYIAGMTLSSLGGLVIAAAGGPAGLALVAVLCGQILHGLGPTLYGINQQTIRQTLVAPELLPRAQASWRFIVFGLQPLGALLGGTLGALVGFRPTLIVASVIMLVATTVALFSPLRAMRRLPELAT